MGTLEQKQSEAHPQGACCPADRRLWGASPGKKTRGFRFRVWECFQHNHPWPQLPTAWLSSPLIRRSSPQNGRQSGPQACLTEVGLEHSQRCEITSSRVPQERKQRSARDPQLHRIMNRRTQPWRGQGLEPSTGIAGLRVLPARQATRASSKSRQKQ